MNNYKIEIKRKRRIIFVTLIALIILFSIDLFTGPTHINLFDLKEIFTLDSMQGTILFNIRLPQSLTAILVGTSLGLCGAVMQTLLSNPLASPFTLGISSASSFGASLFLILGFPMIYISTGALLFSFVATVFIYIIGKKMQMNTYSIVLSGIAVKFMFEALLSLVQYKASDETLEYIIFWIFGSLNKTDYVEIIVLAIMFIASFIIILNNSWSLTAMRFGEERAISLGVDTKKVKIKLLVIISCLSAICVSFCGTIGFIGLCSPHISKRFVGEDQRFYLIESALVGAIILLISSIFSKLIKPGMIIPVGIISSLIGIPFLIYAIVDRKN